jgi:hypothetical protein
MSESTIRVRVARPQFRYNYEHYEEGDELEVPEAVLERHARDLDVVDEAEGEDDDADAEAAFAFDPDDVDPHPSDLTVDEIQDRIDELEDVAQLRAIRHLEAEDQSRSTALEAIDGRINDLEADEEE